jgi:GNAT superfamily N-acetyltransferase
MSIDIIYRSAVYDKRHSDATAICELYRQIFNVDMTETFDFWYGNNPAGCPYGVVACDGDKIVGHFGTMSILTSVMGHEMKGRISMGFMVSPDYRGYGIAAKLSNKLFADLKELREDKFVIGFPNDVSYRMHIEGMGYELLRNFSFIELPNNISGSANYRMISSIKHGETPACNVNSVIHSADFLRRRYADPKYSIYVSEDNKLFVCTRFMDKMDLLYWSENASSEDVLAFASYLHMRDGITRVCSWNTYDWMNEYPAEDRRYHMTINIITDNDDERELLRNKWLFYMGDCELF